MAVKKKGLGRGLDALFPEKSVKPTEKKPEQKSVATNESLHQQEEGSLNASAVKSAAETKDTAQAAVVEEPKKSEMLVKISKVEPNRTQPRKQFDEDALLELSESIKQFGILQPLLVSDKGDYYEIIAGERRWRAAKLAGLKEVPVIIKELSDTEAMEIAIIENLQREDLNPIEEAEGLQALIDKCGYTQEQVATSVGKSRPAITNALRLLKLPEEVREMAKDGTISAGHARALLAFDNQPMMIECANQIVSKKLTVRDVEKMAKRPATKSTEQKTAKRRDSFYDEVELSLTEALGTKVRVYNGRNKGTLEIEFYTLDDLKNIANAIAK